MDWCSPEVRIDFRVTFTRPNMYIGVFIRAPEYTWMAIKHIIDHLPHTQSNTKIYESLAVRLAAYLLNSDSYKKLRYQIRTCHQNNLSTNLIIGLCYWNGFVMTQGSFRTRHTIRTFHGWLICVETTNRKNISTYKESGFREKSCKSCKCSCRSKSNFFTSSLRLLLIAMKSNYNYRKWCGDI